MILIFNICSISPSTKGICLVQLEICWCCLKWDLEFQTRPVRTAGRVYRCGRLERPPASFAFMCCITDLLMPCLSAHTYCSEHPLLSEVHLLIKSARGGWQDVSVSQSITLHESETLQMVSSKRENNAVFSCCRFIWERASLPNQNPCDLRLLIKGGI